MLNEEENFYSCPKLTVKLSPFIFFIKMINARKESFTSCAKLTAKSSSVIALISMTNEEKKTLISVLNLQRSHRQLLLLYE